MNTTSDPSVYLLLQSYFECLKHQWGLFQWSRRCCSLSVCGYTSSTDSVYQTSICLQHSLLQMTATIFTLGSETAN